MLKIKLVQTGPVSVLGRTLTSSFREFDVDLSAVMNDLSVDRPTATDDLFSQLQLLIDRNVVSCEMNGVPVLDLSTLANVGSEGQTATYEINGVAVGSRPILNIIGAATAVDNAGLNRVDLQLPTSGLSDIAPAPVTRSVADVGVGVTAARYDHKHDVATSAPGAIMPGSAAAEGTSTALARADHVHSTAAFGTTAGTFCEGSDSRLTGDRIALALRNSVGVVNVFSAAAPTVGQALVALSPTSASWQTVIAGSDQWVQFNDNGVLGADSKLQFNKTTGTVTIGDAVIYPNNPLDVGGSVASYMQVVLQNRSENPSASSDFVVANDVGDDTSYFVNLGMTSSTHVDPIEPIFTPNLGYLYSKDSSLLFGTASPGKTVVFFTGGASTTNKRGELDDLGFNLSVGHSYRVNGVALPLLTSAAPLDVLDGSPTVGTATVAAKSDHVHRIPWTTIRNVLGARAASNSGYVFKSNGLGGGDMYPNLQAIPNRYTVGTGGDVDFTSIALAINAAVAAGGIWEIVVYPGTYTEPPMTLPTNINVIGSYGNRITEAIVIAENPNADLFTCTGGVIAGLSLAGVRDPSHALVRCDTASSLVVLHGIALTDCTTGIYVGNGATVIATDLTIRVSLPDSKVGNGVHVNGPDSFFGVSGGYFYVPASVVSSYSSNPIQTCVYATNSGLAHILGITIRVAHFDSTADVILSDSNSIVTVISTEIFNSCNAFHIGPNGSTTEIVTFGCVLTNNTLDHFIESATGVIFANHTTDINRSSVVSGGKVTGTVQYRSDNSSKLIGNIHYIFPSGNEVDFADYFSDSVSTGVCDGGDVTSGGGLLVNVSAGDGWCVRPAPENDAAWVSWTTRTGLVLAPASTNYVLYDLASRSIIASTSPAGSDSILLSTVITDGSAIRFLHNTRRVVDDALRRFDQYLLSTRKVALQSGCATTLGSNPLTKFEVSSGSYYVSYNALSFPGSSGDAVFSYFYGVNGAVEVGGQTSIDTTNYDSSGTLTPMTAGYYRSDTVYLTSDGRISVIYGTAEYATDTLAKTALLAQTPTFIEPTAFPSSQIIVKQGVGISEIVDARSVYRSGVGGSVAVHAALAGLSADDHLQYLPVSGTRGMSASLNMGGNAITNVGNVDGVDVSAHASRHNPGGADALATGVPVAISVGATPDAGAGSSYARNDHQHGITTGVPVAVGSANAAGTASSVSRSDHVHAHGSQNGGTLHAVATTSSAGFMSAADKTALSTLVAGNTSIPVRNETGAPLLKGRAVAVIGWNSGLSVPLVAYADKDTESLRPAVGILQADLPDVTTGTATTQGLIEGVDTSAWGLTDQLVLGNNGALMRPPPSTSPFTGEVQNVASTVRIDATDGHIVVSIDGLEIVTADQVFALGGTSGTPGPANKYVTDTDARLTNARVPTAHAATHKHLGSDEVATATATANAIPKAGAAGTLDIGWIPVGSTGTQVCIGNDARLSDDRTASGLRTTSGIVTVNTAAPPTTGQALVATSGTAATWQSIVQLTSSAPVDVSKAAANVGVGTTAARSDHKHDCSTAAAVGLSVGGANAEGVASSLARSDHLHALPAFGTALGTFCQGNDARLSDDRTASGLRTLTTVVSISSATAPTAGQVLTATSGTAATWQTPTLPTTQIAEVTTSTTTTSITDVNMGGMSITPAAGTYMVWFSADVSHSQNGGQIWISIYAGGTQNSASEKYYYRGTQLVWTPASTMAKVTVNGALAIEGRWRTSGPTASNNKRQLHIMRVA